MGPQLTQLLSNKKAPQVADMLWELQINHIIHSSAEQGGPISIKRRCFISALRTPGRGRGRFEKVMMIEGPSI